ncbi:MAG: hypothetical protein QMD77_03170 [Patescibacteria group bacterium]|nr:hypothetical protein [Patescibacteria group bacterium]
MELKEYYKIWREHISVVIYAVLVAVVAVYAWSVKKSETYYASLLLDVSRVETQPTAEYKYDQFYRLQADEKFAETVSEWLKSSGAVRSIFDKAGVSSEGKTMRGLSKSFQAEKLSSQLVSVRFSPQNEDEAKKIANAVSAVVSDKTKGLNAEARDPNWFKVDMSDLIVLKNTQDLRLNLALAAFVGLFVGTLLAFGKHYISE